MPVGAYGFHRQMAVIVVFGHAFVKSIWRGKPKKNPCPEFLPFDNHDSFNNNAGDSGYAVPKCAVDGIVDITKFWGTIGDTKRSQVWVFAKRC